MAYVVVVDIENYETGDEALTVFGTFASRDRATEFMTKLSEKTDAEAQAAEGVSVSIGVYGARRPLLREATRRVKGMIEEAVNS